MSVSRRSMLASGVAVAAHAAQSSRPADAQDANAPAQRRTLQSRVSLDALASGLLPREKWRPYPDASDRASWQNLAADLREQIVQRGAEALKGEWTFLPASVFLQFVRNGNRSNYERLIRSRRERLEALVLAECVEAKGRFLDEIANGIWTTCEESWWGYPAHLSGAGLPDPADPIIDLFAAEAGSLLAWTDYLIAPQLDKVHKRVGQRLRYEIDRRILTPYEKRTDFWWMGLEADRPMNNWNPWINSNCLACTLLIEKDAKRRVALAHKIVRSVDRFLDSYHADGGCDEGPGYWGHAGGSLFDNLELLRSASSGRIDLFNVPLVQEIGRYIYRAHINDDWYVNFADASAKNSLNGDLVYRYGKRIGDQNMQLLGAWAEQSKKKGFASFLRELPALFNYAEIRKAPAKQPLIRDAWLSGVQVMTARRTAGSTDGLYLAAQGGHNAESHNHNDVGNFVVFANGKPVIVDAGVETYTAKTFSSKRYEIWTMQSAYHNLPTVNGVMQAAGRSFAARNVAHKSSDQATEFSLDIGAAYPREAGIETWNRTLRLDRAKNEITVRDAFVLQKAGGRVEFTLMTPEPVSVNGGVLTLCKTVGLYFDPQKISVVVEDVPTTDSRLRAVWGERLLRVLLKSREPLPAKGEFNLTIRQNG
jgi:hypothetical protein